MSSKSKLIIGLLQVNADPWKNIYKKGQFPTWISASSENVSIVNIYGNSPNKLIRVFDNFHEKCRWSPLFQGPIHLFDRQVGKKLSKLDNPEWRVTDYGKIKNIFVKFPSTHLTLPNVEIGFYKYFLNCTDADFLYMSNTSSYVNTKNLEIFINNLGQKTKIYGGTINQFAGITYASGSNRLISRDLVMQIVNCYKFWDFSLVEDVSMGKLLQSEFCNIINIPSLTFSTLEEISLEPLPILLSNIHFRLKSGSLNSRKDIELMHLLQKRLNSKV